MECRQFGSKLVVRIDKGEEILTVIRSLYQSHGIKLASISGIGAVSRANIGIFIQDTKEYRTKELTGSMEIVSMAGNIRDGRQVLHSLPHHAYRRELPGVGRTSQRSCRGADLRNGYRYHRRAGGP